jgi:RNA polymerase sigma-70 factor, ECF subfamily
MTSLQSVYPTGEATPNVDLSEPARFEGFVLAHSHTVLRVCHRMLKDACAAEDACQETFAAAWRQRENLRPNRSWLLKVATNKCLDELRRRARHFHCPLDEDEDGAAFFAPAASSPETAALTAHDREVLQQALEQLPWPQRVAVVLCDAEDWSYGEIASACGVSIGTVKSRVFRARTALREILRQSGL